MQTNFRNFAFISYSRKDAAVARDLWHRLEKYPYPQHLIDDAHRPSDNKYVRPVFLDTADLSVSHRNFSEEIRENIIQSKYLIVLCSPSSAESKFVAAEIECFVTSHGGETKNIIPVIIDRVTDKMSPYMAELLENRNCPIWNSDKSDKNAKMDNRYCFYHVLEYMLGIDFNKLFSRYLHYTKRRRAIRLALVSLVFAVCLGLSLIALQKEKEVSSFEKGTFPFSLVAGYTDNFLIPLLNTLVDSSKTITPHVFIYMPYRYAEINSTKREKVYDHYIERNYEVESSEEYAFKVKNRHRDLTGHRKKLKSPNCMLYTDNARTVIAIKEVIDFKQRQTRLFSSQSQDEMAKEYTDLFIAQTYEKLNATIPQNPYIKNVHFIKNQHALDSVMQVIGEQN